ncbi:hypothetical protein KIN20_030618 [Parelaphostrongylus tenuis]|uniref:Uncharacterized protein n=1 Tax=Parelaphostrongylus tenuis TaxID=148309 RepID=A0AAD5R437_PARTN|nr:hypothetical protein KIN20_030614 [Parelaphostrongylus tenuis]KAJ1369210.1 hypothetical protein KIN20_030618 [Parelaphostrongylus tenuis]
MFEAYRDVGSGVGPLGHPRSEQTWGSKRSVPPSLARKSPFGKKITICCWWSFEGACFPSLLGMVVSYLPNSLRAVGLDLGCVEEKLADVDFLKERAISARQCWTATPKSKDKLERMEEVEVSPHRAYNPHAAPSE